jgi:glyoxylase I family protein
MILQQFLASYTRLYSVAYRATANPRPVLRFTMSDSTAATAAIRVKTIDHVTIVVRSLERSSDFYRDVLGMQKAERPDFGFPGLWFQAGSTQVHLIEHQQGCSEPGGGLDPDRLTAGMSQHFAFEVEDAHTAVDVLKAHDVRIQGGPSRRPDGCIQVWFYDPDGHCVEVFDRSGLH